MVKTLAHCLIWYLPPTMGYVHDQLLALGRDRSVVFAAEAVDPERFPLDRVYIFSPPAFAGAPPPRARPLVPPFDYAWRPVVREEHVALLHVHDGRIAPRFLPLARYHHIPIVTTFLGRDATAGLDGGYRDALLGLFARGDLFTVMSHHMARQLRSLGCPDRKIRVIQYGISLARFPFIPRQAPIHSPPVILFTGRLIDKKGPLDLARAFALLHRRYPDACLRVIGEGPLRPSMEAIFSEAGVGHRVQFLGMLTPPAAAEEMRQAHIFCLPSCVGADGDSEGMPTVLKEAMASGLPVVSTHHAGIPELVEDGVSGQLVPEHDVAGLADRLYSLLQHPGQWEKMGKAGRHRVEAEFSVGAIVSRLQAEVYQPLLGGGCD